MLLHRRQSCTQPKQTIAFTHHYLHVSVAHAADNQKSEKAGLSSADTEIHQFAARFRYT